MKKTAIMLCSALVILALTITGTIAYFTDADQATNIFTVGNVVIDLIEQQRNGSFLVDFVNNKKLMPMFAPTTFDSKGLPTAQEFQDKIVRVENTGKSDAYIRVYVGVPAELDNKEVLHLLDGSRFNTATGNSYTFSAPTKITGQTVGAETFNFYCFTLNSALKVGDTTGAAIVGVYLDEKVDYSSADGKYYIGSKKDTANKLETNLDNPVNIPVYVQAVQIDGFSTAASAFSAAFKEAPWGGALPPASETSTEPAEGAAVDTDNLSPLTENNGTYCKSRRNARTNTKLGNKGLIRVRRFIEDDGSTIAAVPEQKPEQTVSGNTVTITGAKVNIRKGCGADFGIVKIARRGDKFERPDTDGWRCIKYNGACRWISNKYINALGDCTGASVNVRSGPGTGFLSVGIVRRSERLELVKTDGWVPIVVDNAVCWVSEKYVG